MPLKILFIQLPLLDHGYFYINGNVEYAPATISAYLQKRYSQNLILEQLPFIISNFAVNRIILKYIDAVSPDVVAFTCYLWNVERNLEIAKRIKGINEHISIIFGGPEIAGNSWALSEKRDCVDYFVHGEGEWFFQKYIDKEEMVPYSCSINGNLFISQPENELIDSKEIVEPFTAKRLNAMTDGSIFLELVRGCPYQCIYCYYSKNCTRVRELPFDILIQALKQKEYLNLNEIYILCPTFNKTKDFSLKLDTLAAMKHGVSLHTEMRTDNITKERALMLYKAGFRSMEVGLQTLNKKSLQYIGRDSKTEDELNGMLELKDAGIDLKIGIIPGLPEDSSVQFKNTVDKLVEYGFGENIELYPLMILPGTGIREEADNKGIVYQKKPPYYLIKGWNFDYDDMKDIIQYLDDQVGYNYGLKRLPDFTKGRNEFVRGITFNGNSATSWDGAQYRDLIHTSVFDFFIELQNINMLGNGLRNLFNGIAGCYEYAQVIIESDVIVDEKIITDFLIEIDSDSFYRRLHIFDEWNMGHVVMFFQLFQDIDQHMLASEKYTLIEPILKLTEKNYNTIINKYPSEDLNVLISENIYNKVKDFIISTFKDSIEQIAFESEQDQERFYCDIGEEYVKYPFSFRVVKK